ncbi:MAG: hypothetical protein DIZ78_11370 [endosymbiont of Escarpia spicata]|uniref:PpiC domain-containing protein n=1 Tax=endosymbiont of Escarpia spicata TaxID=2200908 RepID=A0A370DLT8_9GAMM|nr:MAG: hypothetical protein DIZ78_11370 [endosymbiont of Escarpia spicata]
MSFKEPLLHFLILGALIFWFYDAGRQDASKNNEIVVTEGLQRHLATVFQRTWLRSPTQEELAGIVDDWILSEIAYREGLEMGLDQDDTIIRRRLRQKLEVVADEVVSLPAPSREVLEQYLADHQADYTAEQRYSLRQVFFSRERSGTAVEDAVQAALARLGSAVNDTDPATLGDPLALPHRFESERESFFRKNFGEAFASSLNPITPGRWHGPVPSAYGLHLVLIEDKVAGRAKKFSEAESELRRDWVHVQRNQAIKAMYNRLRAKYKVTVESPTDGSEASS